MSWRKLTGGLIGLLILLFLGGALLNSRRLQAVRVTIRTQAETIIDSLMVSIMRRLCPIRGLKYESGLKELLLHFCGRSVVT